MKSVILQKFSKYKPQRQRTRRSLRDDEQVALRRRAPPRGRSHGQRRSDRLRHLPGAVVLAAFHRLQAGCATVVVACYTAAGAVFGTVAARTFTDFVGILGWTENCGEK